MHFRRDPPDPVAARVLAREMFRVLDEIPPHLGGRDNPELFERAAVLADVLLYTDRPEIGEALALAVAGRVSPYSAHHRFGHLGVGTPIPERSRVHIAHELASAIHDAQNIMFPPRRSPCMPNARALRTLVDGTDRNVERRLRDLSGYFRTSCRNWQRATVEEAMAYANDVLDAHGVDQAAYEITLHGENEEVVSFYYLNTGDTYNTTLVADNLTRRYRISTFGDEVERAERRFGEDGTWRL